MTLSELNNKLTSSLRSFIKDEGFVDSGKLVNSIEFKCTFVNDVLNIKFTSLEYIKYIDDGKLISKFLEKEKQLNLIKSFYVFQIEIDL